MTTLIHQDFEKIAKALADTHRLKILKALREKEFKCGELQDLLELSQPTISHHVKILIESGLVQANKEGRCLFLSLNCHTFESFLKQVQNFLC